MRKLCQVPIVTLASLVLIVSCVPFAAKTAVESLVVTVPIAATPAWYPIYLASAMGLFKEEGVDVTIIDGAGQNTMNIVVAGQADIGQLGPPGPLLASAQGKPMSIIYAPLGSGLAGNLVSRKNITALEQLSGKRVATTGVGSSVYGWAIQLKRATGVNFDLVTFNDVPTLLAALQSGQVDGAVGSYDYYNELIETAQVNVLIDLSKPADRAKYVLGQYPEGTTFGPPDRLKAKKESVVRFLRAYDRAMQMVTTGNTDDVVAKLKTAEQVRLIPEDKLKKYMLFDRQFYAPERGFITRENWAVGLKQYELWGIPNFKGDDPAYSYEARVDMSYLEAAIDKQR